MNTPILRILATLTLGAALGPVCLMAEEPTRFVVPFGFTMGPKSFAAGGYTVRTTLAPSVVALKSDDGSSSIMALSIGVDGPTVPRQAKLIFHRYGDRYFLSQVWMGRDNTGRQLPPSPQERELIAKAASPEAVALTASTRK